MKTEKLSGEKNYMAFVPFLAIIAGVFSSFSTKAAGFKWMDNILDNYPEYIPAVVVGLLLPSLMLIICFTCSKSRVKVSAILFVKIVLELLMLPFGINLNVPTEFFFGDFGFMFFVFIDIVLLITVQNDDIGRQAERGIAAACLTAVGIVLAFTVVMQRDAYTFMRAAYVLALYLFVFLLARDMDYITFDETDPRLSGDLPNGMLLGMLGVSALASCITTVLIAGVSRELIENEIYFIGTFVCSGTWIVICLFAGAFSACVCNRYTKTKGVIISLITAAAATAVCFFTVNYISGIREAFILRSADTEAVKEYLAGSEVASRELFIYVVTIFSVTYMLMHLALRYIIREFELDKLNELFDSDDFDDFDDLDGDPDVFTDFHCKASEAFSLVRREGNIISFDFKNRTPVDSEGRPVFDKGYFVMDSKRYDILLCIEDEQEKTKFIVYTDNSKEKNGKIRVYASKYNPLIDAGRLLPIESEEEWNVVERILDDSIADIEKEEKEERQARLREGGIDSFATLSYLANAIALDKGNDTPFILTLRDDRDEKGLISVIMTGNEEERESLVKYTMMSLVKSLNHGEMIAKEAYRELSRLALESVWDVYKQEADGDEPLLIDEEDEEPDFS